MKRRHRYSRFADVRSTKQCIIADRVDMAATKIRNPSRVTLYVSANNRAVCDSFPADERDDDMFEKLLLNSDPFGLTVTLAACAGSCRDEKLSCAGSRCAPWCWHAAFRIFESSMMGPTTIEDLKSHFGTGVRWAYL